MLKKVNSLPNMARVISSTNVAQLASQKTFKPSFLNQSPKPTPKFGFGAALQTRFDENYAVCDKTEKAFVGSL